MGKRKKQTKSKIAQRKSTPNIIMAAAYIVFPSTDLQKLREHSRYKAGRGESL
jgi:hypothetical protein